MTNDQKLIIYIPQKRDKFTIKVTFSSLDGEFIYLDNSIHISLITFV